jgi:hypothetical protein
MNRIEIPPLTPHRHGDCDTFEGGGSDTEALQEYVDSRGVTLRVDREAGILRGVKLIGLESLNGRRYRPEALTAAIGLYEGAKVNVNHPKDGPLAPRDYRDRLGVIRQVEFRPGEGVFGNLHFNPKHALAEQLAWDAEHQSRNVGFSHNVLAKLTRTGEETVVYSIARVQSVDLVADPAATQGLFEQEAGGAESPVEESLRWESLTLEQLREYRPDLAARDEASDVESLRSALEQLTGRERRLERRLRILERLDAHGLGMRGGDVTREAVGAAFFAALEATETEEQLEALIVERSQALQRATVDAAEAQRSARPRATEQGAALRTPPRAATAVDFAKALRSR